MFSICHNFPSLVWTLVVLLCAFGLMFFHGLIQRYFTERVKYKVRISDLLTTYTFDFEKALEERLENLKKYSYPFDLNQVDKRNNLPLQEFLDIYDGKWPVIINDIVHNWQAFNWTKDFFMQQYRNANIIMSSSNNSSLVVPMGSFLEQIDIGKENSWLYLQDELFLLQYPELRKQIEDSVYTNDNFFNLFPEEVRPWDCYFLWGTAHSRSSLHIDPYNWTGTNAVLTGRKRWKLILPGQDKYLSVYPDKICGFPLDCRKYNSPIDLFADDKETELLLNEIQYLEVDQLPGEMLFIPTGWFHQAFNVEPTLAISGQLMNENNFISVLEEILKAGSLQRSDLAEDLDGLTDDPKALVKGLMLRLPKQVLIRGAQETQRVLASIRQGPYLTT